MKYEEDQRVLGDGLLRDDLSCTATDSSFTTYHDKIAGQNVIDVRGGNSSAEIRIEVNYMEAVVCREMSSEDYVAIDSTNAAKLLGLYRLMVQVRIEHSRTCHWSATASLLLGSAWWDRSGVAYQAYHVVYGKDTLPALRSCCHVSWRELSTPVFSERCCWCSPLSREEDSWDAQGAALGRVAMQTKFARAGKAALS